MSITIQQKKKSRKTFDEIVEEIRTVLNKTKAVYVEMMCDALRFEHRDNESDELQRWDNNDIQIKVFNTCLDFGWNRDTVYEYLPYWIHDQVKVRAQKAGWERRHKVELEKAKTKILSIASDKIKEPKLSREEGEEESDEWMDEPMLESYGGNVESALSLYANINLPARELFKALTRKEIPGPTDDLVLDYLKPSREFRKGIFYEVEENMTTGLYNTLVFVRDAINDTLHLLDTINRAEK